MQGFGEMKVVRILVRSHYLKLRANVWWHRREADSSGRRNGLFVSGLEHCVERLGRGFPIEDLAGSCIEGGRHVGDILGPMSAKAGTFREVPAQQPVGGALPWGQTTAAAAQTKW